MPPPVRVMLIRDVHILARFSVFYVLITSKLYRMAKLSECLRGTLPAEFVSAQIWAKVGEPRQIRRNGGRRASIREESCTEIFRECQGQRMRKKVRQNCTPSTGSVVMAVRLGTYTSCVCKHKM